ncbi:nucleotide-diphospho-sugar transferase [Kockiozyma suomiensis]|uniref:nucleotide-diphospho-sugar transferase n=1 Tax=Kockiozyma suomiensis TaxID=1337062 RepID=UPI003343DA3D
MAGGRPQRKRSPVVLAVCAVLLLFLLFRTASRGTTPQSSPVTASAKHPAHAAHRPQPDLSTPETLDAFRSATVKSLAELFPYDPRIQTSYPRHIWQTWKHSLTDSNFEHRFVRTTESWTHLNHDYTFEVLNDAAAAAMVRQLYASIPDVVDAYFAMPVPVLRADFFRYLILLARGGVYSDIDTLALKSINKWFYSSIGPLKDGEKRHQVVDISDEDAAKLRAKLEAETGLVIGIEADPDREDWHDWYARRVQFCQWTIMAKKGHPVLVDIVSHITTETIRRRAANALVLPKSNEAGSQIMDWTGPGIWTDTIFEYLETDWHSVTGITEGKVVKDVLILPITSFSPGVGSMGAGEITHPRAFSQHSFEGSWKPEKDRHIGNVNT